MKNLIIAAAVAVSTAAMPAAASISGNPVAQADFDMLDEANALAMCGVYKGLFGNCSRVADELGLAMHEAHALAREYWNTAPADRAGFLADLDL